VIGRKAEIQMARYRLFLAAALLAGCSSDAATIPQPDVTTPGAFVATPYGSLGAAGQTPGQGYGLFRTLDVLPYANTNILAIGTYDVQASTLDEARDIARGADPSLTMTRQFVNQMALPTPFSVVWFRTLTAAEAALGQ
jgi:hypothetical protein